MAPLFFKKPFLHHYTDSTFLMKHKSLISIVLTSFLIIAIISGCGGGGGGKKTPENCLSSDYFGLEVGYTRNYKGTFSDSKQGINISFTMTKKVVEELEPGLFKTQSTTSFSGLNTSISGDFILKNADGNYYDRGHWDEEDEDLYMYEPTEEDILISNPVYIGYTSCYYGTVVKSEKVSVPAGNFTAWLFEWEGEGEDEDEELIQYREKNWFVPYIGIVKFSIEGVKNGEKIISGIYSLTSYYISSSAASSDFVSQSINNTADSPVLLKLQKIILKRKK